MSRGDEVLVFHPIVARWFAERLGEPTAPQRRGWPAIAAGDDVLIAAPTGTGKTLAAFLWCIDRLLRRAEAGALEDRTSVVYVSPLKALSHDVHVNLTTPLAELSERLRAERPGAELPELRVAVRTGDTKASEREAQARRPAHLLVTTPESLYILLTTRRGSAALAGVEAVIVDEIHAVADDRRGAHLALSLERLDHLVMTAGGRARRPQRIGLSATQHPIELVGAFLTGGGPCTIVNEGHARALDMEVLAPGGELGTVATNEQWGDVYDGIAELARAHRTTIVFANSRRVCEKAAHALSSRLGEDAVGAHHGALARPVRLEVERRLREGSLRLVVATASLELGIDVGAVDLVCQLGSPRVISTFLQRVGRAGHALRATPKGRLWALTRDDLVECTALVRAVRAGRLDALVVPDRPLDILAQQLVAACAQDDWDVEALYGFARRAWPYRDLARDDFEAVLDMLAEGVATRKGRSSAHLHRDRVNGRVRARRGARLAAIRSGGAIPDRADYEVVLDPEGIRIGTLEEDFAIESMAGEVFLLGNMSWRIRRVEAGRVRVEDARGMAPTIPFWLGEAPGRTRELSDEVARLREEIAAHLADEDGGVTWLGEPSQGGLAPLLAGQVRDYVAATRAALGAVPSTRRVIAERFFDEAGGMQLVLHAPFGQRINRAWGLALRKRFCRNFDFELQAAATDDGVLLSLGDQHSFPLETIADYVPPAAVREILVQAALQAPMFETRWRWNATRALAVLRYMGGRKVPPPILRMRSADLLSAVFPAATGCQDNHGGGDLEPPDHPLVQQTLRDCLEEAMDAEGLREVLERLRRGEIEFVARDTPEPSPMSHAILNANPYAFLDDAPLEERRARAVSVRRGLPADVAAEVGALDPEAIATVRREAVPPVRDLDELHDLLCVVGVLPRAVAEDGWVRWLDELAGARRAARVAVAGAELWVAAERLLVARAAYGDLAPAPAIDAPAGVPRPDRDDAILTLVRGRLEHAGPTTEAVVAGELHLSAADVAQACARLEGDGLILRGRFTAGASETEWCDRRLLARIHRLTLGRLRREIEPVNPADLLRFLAAWQHRAGGTQLHGVPGVQAVLQQLAGHEAAVAAWEQEILPARVADYEPWMLDELCLAGDIVWGRRSPSTAGITTRATPIAFWPREASPWMLAGRAASTGPLDEGAEQVAAALRARGALFYAELQAQTGLPRVALDDALWALVASGRITADGFGALRALGAPDGPAAKSRGARRSGRWSLLEADPATPAVVIEEHARQLLRRYGIVFRDLTAREAIPPWRELLVCYRRMEARGELRGGRFVAGFVGEQFAVPAAVEALRAVRRADAPPVTPPPRDPLHLRALLPGEPVAA